MTRLDSSAESEILMLGGVEARHRGHDGRPATVSCQSLTALAALPPGAAPEAAPQPADERALLRRLRAEGEVFLRTPERDFECGALDYDARAGIVELVAPAGGTVAVTTRGAAQQVRFQRARWDLATDTVTAVSVSGGG